MVGQNTRRRDAARTKANILNAAISEFALRGPAGTRVDEIAARAGVNKSLIYQYFGSKQELYAEALNSVLQAITEKSAEYSLAFSGAADGDALRRVLRDYLDNHLRMLESVPEYPRLIAWENLEGGRTLKRLPVQHTYRQFLTRIEEILEPVRERGLLSKEFDLRHAAQSVMAVTHYFIVHQGTLRYLFDMDPNIGENREGWLDWCTAMMLASFRAHAEAPQAQPEQD